MTETVEAGSLTTPTDGDEPLDLSFPWLLDAADPRGRAAAVSLPPPAADDRDDDDNDNADGAK